MVINGVTRLVYYSLYYSEYFIKTKQSRLMTGYIYYVTGTQVISTSYSHPTFNHTSVYLSLFSTNSTNCAQSVLSESFLCYSYLI